MTIFSLPDQAVGKLEPGEYISLVYQDRMRTADDKGRVALLYSQVFGADAHLYQPSRVLHVTPSYVQAGHAFLRRETRVGRGSGDDGGGGTLVLHHSLGPLESLMTCVSMGWMAILVSAQEWSQQAAVSGKWMLQS